MKKILSALLIMILISSCDKKDINIKDPVTENGMEKLKQDIEILNTSFFKNSGLIDYPDNTKYNFDDSNAARWKGPLEDLMGASTGIIAGVRLGKYAGPWGVGIGALVGGVITGAAMSIEWVEDIPTPTVPIDHPNCLNCDNWAYQVNKKQPMFYGYVNLSEGNNSFEIDFLPIHNESNPYLDLGDYGVMQLGKAEDIGILHNLLIQRIHQENPDFIFDADIHQIIERVFQEFQNFGFDIEMGFPGIREELTAEILMHLENRNWEYYQDIEFQILREYFDNISLMNTQQAIEYTREFRNIVADADIDESTSISIRGAISVAVNSKVLWNLNLPSPEDEYLFWVMDENFSHAYIVPWEYAQALIVNNPDYFAGVARIVDCEVTEIYYYKGSSKEMNIDYIEELASYNAVVPIYEDVLINNGGYIPCDPIMKEGAYQAYLLIHDGEYDYQVYVLKRLD